jgi:hypothetical protein
MRGLKIKKRPILIFLISISILSAIAYINNKLSSELFLKQVFFSVINAYCFDLAFSKKFLE